MDNPTPDSVRRQLQQRLASLQHGGVEFLPARGPLPAPPVAVGVASTELFAAEPPTVESTLESRRHELTVLAEAVSNCTRCPELQLRTQTVFGVGPVGAELCFIGEAPGQDEDRTGEPFVGAAGQLLNKIIAASGLKREEVFICNILRCRPPGNRVPKPNEAANCREWLDRTLELVGPKYICCLGGSAANYLLNRQGTIGSLRRQFFNYNGMTVMCTYHPSFLLRSPTFENKSKVWDDMKMLLQKMGRPVPQGGKKE